MKSQTLNTQTAHQIWCDWITGTIMNAVAPNGLEDKKAFFNMAKSDLLERAASAANQVNVIETTRLRVVVDALVELLEASTRRQHEIKAEAKATVPWRFAKIRRLERQHAEQFILQQGYQAAVKALTNTPPPAQKLELNLDDITEEDKKAFMEALKKEGTGKVVALSPEPAPKICEHCEGTGYAEVNRGELCPHCKGSGTEPGPFPAGDGSDLRAPI